MPKKKVTYKDDKEWPDRDEGRKEYDGEVNSKGIPHGIGKMIYVDDAYYDGNHDEGYHAQAGVFTNTLDCKFDCKTWEKNNMKGEYCFTDTEGHWFDGNGDTYDPEIGKFTRADKTLAGDTDWYEGEWRDGKRDGTGIDSYRNGDRYEGEFKEDKKHGKGIYYYMIGEKYEGEFEAGKFCGQGTYTWASGYIHEGGWRDGKRHGMGTFTKRNGEVMKGRWEEDKYMGEE